MVSNKEAVEVNLLLDLCQKVFIAYEKVVGDDEGVKNLKEARDLAAIIHKKLTE